MESCNFQVSKMDSLINGGDTIVFREDSNVILPKNIKILKAWWGVPFLNKGILCDTNNIKNGMIVNNDTIGCDPVIGYIKFLILKVIYSEEGYYYNDVTVKKNISCIEGCKLILPKNTIIEKALWGVPGINEVEISNTNNLNGKIINNEILNCTDPNNGKIKTLTVSYKYNYEKIIIVTTPVLITGVTDYIQSHIKNIVNKDVELVTTFPFENNDNYLYIFLYLYNIYDVKKYPKNYIVWQIEQLTSKDQVAHSFKLETLVVFHKAIAVFEISMKNYKMYKAIDKKKVYYNPLPFYNEVTDISLNKKNIDCVFFGTSNIRRYHINNYLKRELNKNGITFKVLYSVFNKELTDILKKTKYIINLHYYDKPCLEAGRINLGLENNCLTISEDVFEDDVTKKLYNDYVIYNPCIKDDLSNIDIFVNSIIHNLKPEIYKKNCINLNDKDIFSVKSKNMLKTNLSFIYI